MTGKSRRGFAAMPPDKQREIASKGGKAAHHQGRAHEFTPEEARIAGRKGGQIAHQRNRARQFGPSTPEAARDLEQHSPGSPLVSSEPPPVPPLGPPLTEAHPVSHNQG